MNNMPYQNQFHQTSFNVMEIKATKVLSANTYAEEKIVLPKQQGQLLPGLLEIIVEFEHSTPSTVPFTVAAADRWGFHLATDTNTAILSRGSAKCMAKEVRFCHSIGAAAGYGENSFKTGEKFPAPLLVSSAEIYVGLISTQACTAAITIRYTPRYAQGVVQQNNLNQTVQY